jgi:predicted nucleotidyltransferase
MNIIELRNHRDQIINLAEQAGVVNIRVFGSLARGEDNKNSDVDLLATVMKGSGLKFVGLQLQLEELLHCKVDLVSDKGLNRHLADKILQEAVDL